jgi:hypothetical protein
MEKSEGPQQRKPLRPLSMPGVGVEPTRAEAQGILSGCNGPIGGGSDGSSAAPLRHFSRFTSLSRYPSFRPGFWRLRYNHRTVRYSQARPPTGRKTPEAGTARP